MMRRHTSNHRTVEAYVDDELPGPLRLMMAAHLLVCPGCKDHADTVRSIKQSLRSRMRPTSGIPSAAVARPRLVPAPTLLSGIGGGTVAGAVMAGMTMWLMITTGMPAMFPLAATATIVPGQGALAGANPLVGIVVHFVLAATYGALFVLLIRRARLRDGAAVIASGLVFGVALYLINFVVLANAMFDAFTTFNQPFQVLNHIVYGAVTGLLVTLRNS